MVLIGIRLQAEIYMMKYLEKPLTDFFDIAIHLLIGQ
jgi:hypothetical protein